MTQWDKHRGMACVLADRFIKKNDRLKKHYVDIVRDIETIFWEAEQTFDEEQGVKFMTYASLIVTQRVNQLLLTYTGNGIRKTIDTHMVSFDPEWDCVGGELDPLEALLQKEQREIAARLADVITCSPYDRNVLRLAPRFSKLPSIKTSRYGKFKSVGWQVGTARAAQYLSGKPRPDSEKAAKRACEHMETLDDTCKEILDALSALVIE